LAHDVTGDGVVDIVIGGDNWQSGLYPGLGAGLFGPRQLITTLGGDERVVYGDMDGDTDVDIVVADNATGGKTLLLANDGMGNFSIADTITATNTLGSLVADVDYDGDLDLTVATTLFEVPALIWRLNDGTGTNWTYKQFGTSNPFQAVADIDQDGSPELLVARNYMISWYEWIVDDQWSPSVNLEGSISGPTTLAVADLDQDGDQDLATSTTLTGELFWIPNAGDGTFGPRNVVLSAVSDLIALHAVDLNGDGAPDLVGESTYGFRVLLNNGTGTAWSETIIPSMTGSQARLAIGDLDDDGDPDIVDQGGWWANDGNGTFTSVANTSWTYAASSGRLKLGDMNGDGLLDVVLGNSTSIWCCINLGGGSFNTLVNSNCFGHVIELADLDEDGDLDVMNINTNIADVFGCFNDGAGNLTQQMIYDGPASWTGVVLNTGDINGDGHMDVVHSRAFSSLRVTSYNLGLGQGTLEEAFPFSSGSGSIYYAPALADLDGDEVQDLVYPVADRIVWHENLFFDRNRFRGSVFLDPDEDAVLDTNEVKVPYRMVRSDATETLVWANSVGDYDLPADTGTWYVWSAPPPGFGVTHDPDSLTATLTDQVPMVTGLDFGWATIPVEHVQFTWSHSLPFRCNNNVSLWPTLRNTGGTILQDVHMDLYFDADLSIISADPPPDVVAPGHLGWVIDSLSICTSWRIVPPVLRRVG
ncbi:MAG TPA: VCBS repeat-containing protein, partial [Flavobacteriales bacterium]|nr:VCBS repeat-containing protein [Flavobacteriales bacterium]